MVQRMVTYKIAKILKAAGYPQKNTEFRYVLTNSTFDHLWFKEGELIDKTQKMSINNLADAPTYLDVWLWLWREKGIYIQVDYCYTGIDPNINDPEEAIIARINDLVSNKLIK